MNINNRTKFGFPNHIAWQIFPDKSYVYILNLKNMLFIYFDGVSIDIWNNILKGFNVEEIVNDISKKFQVNYEIVKNDVIEFLEDLISKEVIIIKDEI